MARDLSHGSFRVEADALGNNNTPMQRMIRVSKPEVTGNRM